MQCPIAFSCSWLLTPGRVRPSNFPGRHSNDGVITQSAAKLFGIAGDVTEVLFVSYMYSKTNNEA